MIKQSDLKIKVAVGELKKISDGNGLYLYLKGLKNGTTSISFVYRKGKKQSTLTTKDLKQARLQVAKLNTTESAINSVTLNEALNKYLEYKKETVKESTYDRIIHCVAKLDSLKNMLIHKIRTSDVIDLVVKPNNNFKPTLKKAINLLQNTLKYASAYYQVNYDVGILSIDKLYNTKHETKHYTAMTDGDIKTNLMEFWEDCQNMRLRQRLLVALHCHLLLRPANTMHIRKSDIDIDKEVITIPVTKTMPNFKIPLTVEVLRIVNKLIKLNTYNDTDLIYCSKEKDVAFSNCYLSMLLTNYNINKKQTAHGIRAVGRTWMQQNGFSFEVAEACLAHFVGSNAVKAYLRTDYLEERKEVMSKWSNFLSTIFVGI